MGGRLLIERLVCTVSALALSLCVSDLIFELSHSALGLKEAQQRRPRWLLCPHRAEQRTPTHIFRISQRLELKPFARFSQAVVPLTDLSDCTKVSQGSAAAKAGLCKLDSSVKSQAFAQAGGDWKNCVCTTEGCIEKKAWTASSTSSLSSFVDVTI